MFHFKIDALTGTPGDTLKIFENKGNNMQSFLVNEKDAYNLVFNKRYIKLAKIVELESGSSTMASLRDF